jgi:hypothetical protein
VCMREDQFHYIYVFLIFFPHTIPFNNGTIEVKIKSYHMGPILIHIVHTTFLAHSKKPHTNHTAEERKKKLHEIETCLGVVKVFYDFNA